VPGLVREEFGPTLLALAGPRLRRLPRGLRAALAIVAALVAVALVSAVLQRRSEAVNEYVQRDGLTFNFRYPDGLALAQPRGTEIVRLERKRADGLFVQSIAVEPLALPAYRGEASGVLPVAADAEKLALERRFRDFELVQEGKTRLNEVSGYGLVFRARLGERRLFGRDVLLPEPRPGARRGVRLLLLATPAAGVSRAEETGVRGVIKRPYRTFRFGTEAP